MSQPTAHRSALTPMQNRRRTDPSRSAAVLDASPWLRRQHARKQASDAWGPTSLLLGFMLLSLMSWGVLATGASQSAPESSAVQVPSSIQRQLGGEQP